MLDYYSYIEYRENLASRGLSRPPNSGEREVMFFRDIRRFYGEDYLKNKKLNLESRLDEISKYMGKPLTKLAIQSIKYSWWGPNGSLSDRSAKNGFVYGGLGGIISSMGITAYAYHIDSLNSYEEILTTFAGGSLMLGGAGSIFVGQIISSLYEHVMGFIVERKLKKQSPENLEKIRDYEKIFKTIKQIEYVQKNET